MKSLHPLVGTARKTSNLHAAADTPLVERAFVHRGEDLFAGPVTMAELERAHKEALRAKGISLEDFRQRLGA